MTKALSYGVAISSAAINRVEALRLAKWEVIGPESF